MSLDDFEETNDPEVSFEVPAMVKTVQGNQLKEGNKEKSTEPFLSANWRTKMLESKKKCSSLK